MKVALVCDWLTTPGGAEKVLLELHRMYPDAPIYTSQYRPKKITWFHDAKVKTGWLNLFPAALRRYIGLFRQIYFSHLNLSDYDLVISVTGAEAKAIKTKPKHSGSTRHLQYSTHSSKSQEKNAHVCYHLCYCHVPTQYYWRLYDEYYQHPGFGIFDPLARLGVKLLVKPLRKADYRAAQRPDQFVTISSYAAAQIKEYYHRDSTVIAPPVDTAEFSRTLGEHSRQGFIISCRQVTWKRVDLAIKACLEAKVPLRVVGDGPEHAKLVKLAAGSPLITFLPWSSAKALAKYLSQSSAYIFPSLEPFGIAAVEALAAGCPVLAYADGGSRDIVRPGQNGFLFPEQTPAALVKTIQEFLAQKTPFNPATVSASADQFAPDVFRQKITDLVARELPS